MIRFVSSAWVLVTLSALSAQAQDFKRLVANTTSTNEVCVTWSSRNIVYVIDSAGSERTPAETEFLAITQSFATWQAVSDGCSDFTFNGGPRQDNVLVGKGSQATNALVFREMLCPPDDPCHENRTCGNTLHCWDHDDAAVIALTTTSYSSRTGIIYDADVEFNASNFLFTTVPSPPCSIEHQSVSCTAYDVQNAATHEIGHMVGFDHVLNGSSTMAATALVGDTQKRIVDFGTQTGFCSTYPRGQPPVPCDQLAQIQMRVVAKNVGTFGCSGAPLGAIMPWGGAALVFLAFSRRRFKARNVSLTFVEGQDTNPHQ